MKSFYLTFCLWSFLLVAAPLDFDWSGPGWHGWRTLLFNRSKYEKERGFVLQSGDQGRLYSPPMEINADELGELRLTEATSSMASQLRWFHLYSYATINIERGSCITVVRHSSACRIFIVSAVAETMKSYSFATAPFMQNTTVVAVPTPAARRFSGCSHRLTSKSRPTAQAAPCQPPQG